VPKGSTCRKGSARVKKNAREHVPMYSTVAYVRLYSAVPSRTSVAGLSRQVQDHEVDTILNFQVAPWLNLPRKFKRSPKYPARCGLVLRVSWLAPWRHPLPAAIPIPHAHVSIASGHLLLPLLLLGLYDGLQRRWTSKCKRAQQNKEPTSKKSSNDKRIAP
jgi:hypothetical protein